MFKIIINTRIFFVKPVIRAFSNSFDPTQVMGELELISYTKSLAILKGRQIEAKLKLFDFKKIEKGFINFDFAKYNTLSEEQKKHLAYVETQKRLEIKFLTAEAMERKILKSASLNYIEKAVLLKEEAFKAQISEIKLHGLVVKRADAQTRKLVMEEQNCEIQNLAILDVNQLFILAKFNYFLEQLAPKVNKDRAKTIASIQRTLGRLEETIYPLHSEFEVLDKKLEDFFRLESNTSNSEYEIRELRVLKNDILRIAKSPYQSPEFLGVTKEILNLTRLIRSIEIPSENHFLALAHLYGKLTIFI
jgi:hypothetical protein